MLVLEWSHRSVASWATGTEKGRGMSDLIQPSSRCYCKGSCCRDSSHHPENKLPLYLEDLIP